MEIKLQLPNGKDYLSYSSSKHLASHPLSYLSYINDKFEPNDGMIFGQFYEDLLFGVDTNDDYFVYDEQKVIDKAIKTREANGEKTKTVRATNEYRQFKEEALADVGNRKIITAEQHEKAIRMGNIMRDSKVFDTQLNGELQVTKSEVIDVDEFRVKALVKSDVVMPNQVVNDLKTTSSVMDGWIGQAKKLGYDLQAFLTYEVWNADDFNFIVQRTEGLHEIGIFNVERDGWFYNSGKAKFKQAIYNYLDFFSPEAKAMEANPHNYVFKKFI